MTVERLGDGFLEVGSRDRLLRQTLEQNLALAQESGRTVAELERKMLDEGLLQNGQLAVLRMALDRTDGLAVEVHRRNHTSRHGMARPVGIIHDHRAAQALRDAAAELGAGHPEILA